MTGQIHMHFTKTFDVPLNDFNEYWGAVQQERENKIDRGFKTRRFFFFLVFTNAVCLTVAVICKGNIVALRSNNNMTTRRRSTSLVLMMDFRKSSGSDIGRLSTFLNTNRSAIFYQMHPPGSYYATLSDNHQLKQDVLRSPNALWGVASTRQVFCVSCELLLYF